MTPELLTLLLDRGHTVATAESLTSGMVGARMAAISGASQVYKGGMITYSLRSKVDLLGTNRETTFSEDGVHPSIARKMAVSVAEKFGASIGIATTGYATPDPVLGYPRAWVAVADLTTGKVEICHLAISRETDRTRAREKVCDKAFEMLWYLLSPSA
tara:strand:- start:2315 stop:2788 length:474 start_codon:yes stop_codon:yes gene_type:complete